jgi:hypothetical protein
MAQSDKYWINARWTLGFRKKIFIVFLLGKDTRGPLQYDDSVIDSQHEQRQAPATRNQVLVYMGVFMWVLLCVFCIMFVLTYILKSAMGIDIFSTSSPFPAFLKEIGFCSAVCH